MKPRTINLEVSQNGGLFLPPEVIKKYGLIPGASIRIREQDNYLEISRAINLISKIYIEPTNMCNLGCSTCMRNVWDEPLGKMLPGTFQKIIQSIMEITPLPTVFFGGYGEPLLHPDTIDMVKICTELGCPVEMITNGTLLHQGIIDYIIKLGVKRLWVSIDGVTPESYSDIRLGNELPNVLKNMYALRKSRELRGAQFPRLGIAFVAMRKNISELAELIRIAKGLGVDTISVSNVLPHTMALRQQILYPDSLINGDSGASEWINAPEISLPRLDFDNHVSSEIIKLFKIHRSIKIGRQSVELGVDSCPFIMDGSVSIRWDGTVSPCPTLMHTNESYLEDHLRKSVAYSVGNLNDQSLQEIWNITSYREFREKVIEFDFAPCTLCAFNSSCYMAEENNEDCYGNSHPSCGGCLWAQGYIQCP